MKQLKKKAVLAIGVTVSLVGMGLNLQYALDDYGLETNQFVKVLLADGTGTGEVDGSDCKCPTAYDLPNHYLKLANCILVWQQKKICSPMAGICCNPEKQTACDGKVN